MVKTTQFMKRLKDSQNLDSDGSYPVELLERAENIITTMFFYSLEGEIIKRAKNGLRLYEIELAVTTDKKITPILNCVYDTLRKRLKKLGFQDEVISGIKMERKGRRWFYPVYRIYMEVSW